MDPPTPMEIKIDGIISIARDGEQLVPLAHVPITVFTVKHTGEQNNLVETIILHPILPELQEHLMSQPPTCNFCDSPCCQILPQLYIMPVNSERNNYTFHAIFCPTCKNHEETTAGVMGNLVASLRNMFATAA